MLGMDSPIPVYTPVNNTFVCNSIDTKQNLKAPGHRRADARVTSAPDTSGDFSVCLFRLVRLLRAMLSRVHKSGGPRLLSFQFCPTPNGG